MENHHFSWENPLFLWPCSIAMLVYQRVRMSHMSGSNAEGAWKPKKMPRALRSDLPPTCQDLAAMGRSLSPSQNAFSSFFCQIWWVFHFSKFSKHRGNLRSYLRSSDKSNGNDIYIYGKTPDKTDLLQIGDLRSWRFLSTWLDDLGIDLGTFVTTSIWSNINHNFFLSLLLEIKSIKKTFFTSPFLKQISTLCGHGGILKSKMIDKENNIEFPAGP